jgi:hypothetical protein
MMNHSTRAMRRPARSAAAIIATAVLALLAAAWCGSPSSTGSSTGSGGSPNAGGTEPSWQVSAHSKLVAFSHCMRSHGVPTWPDPSSNQTNIKFGPGQAQQYGVGSSQFNAARRACQHLLPVGANDTFPAAMMPQILSGMRRFSRCVRSHGVPTWPDPTTNSRGQPVFHISDSLNANSPQVMTAMNECQQLLPPQLHGGEPLG